MAIDVKKRGARIIIFCALLLPFPAAAATVQLPRTGQTACYDASGSVIACAGTGQDGDKLKGAAMPSPRFTDNANGTVTDNLTGLVWLKNANCWGATTTWQAALTNANALSSGSCGLTDGSAAGSWRLPNIAELESLLDLSLSNPAISTGHPFNNVQSYWYWTGSTLSAFTDAVLCVGLSEGDLHAAWKRDNLVGGYYVWPVQGGQ